MSDSASYNSILSQGVQDVAALLPLLGTVQCERHVSLSLQHGYLYAAFAPLSIFGSLGTALAGLWIGLASTVWGVRRLKDAGFEPSSNVAKIITLDNRRYLAESNLIAAMKGLQAQGLQDRGGHMQIKFKDQVSPWNFYLVSASLIAAAASLFPYLHFIIVHDTSSASRAWIFPAMRAMGGFFCIVGGQQLLQKRIVTIVQQRLNFMDISQFLEKEKIDVTTMSIPSPRAIWTFWNRRAPLEKVLIRWDHNKTSEACLQDLYRYLELFEWTADEDRDSEKMKKLLHHISGLPDKPTGERFHKKYLELLGEDSDSKNTVITAELFSKIYRGFYRILIFIGVMASVAGYIGCFSLVQDKKASPRGRYLWIGLEAFLALVRMMIWASNPSFDDLHGLQVCLELSDSSPHDLIMALDEKDSKVTHPTLADPIVTFRTTAPVIDRETFYDAFIKHSGFLPSLRAKSIVPYYTIFENQLCIAFESLKLDETVESVFFLDFQPNDTTPFTLYHAATTAAAAATMGTGATETETPPAEAAAEAEILEVATETAMETAATTEAAVEATAASTPTPTQTQTVTVKDRLFLVAKVKPDDPFHTKNLAPLQELVMQHHFINSVLKNKPSDLKSGHSFDVGWLVNVKCVHLTHLGIAELNDLQTFPITLQGSKRSLETCQRVRREAYEKTARYVETHLLGKSSTVLLS